MPNILVTGGARRIGAAITHALAEAGFGVVIHCNTALAEAEALAAALPRAWVVQADLRDAGAAAGLCARAGELCGGLDGLVNNASLFVYDTPSVFDGAQFRAHQDVNLLAPALLTQGFAAQLAQDALGSVVNLLDNRLYAPNPDYFTYALGKYALAGMTEMAALHFAPRIRVNAVAPAITMISGKMGEAAFQRVHANNPLHHGVTPADVAAAVRYLLQAPAITGEVLVVDAGQRLRRAGRDVAFGTSA